MASSRVSLKRSLLVSAFFAVSLFSTDVLAQATTSPTTAPAPTTAAATTRTSAASSNRATSATPSTSARTTAPTRALSLPPLGSPSSVAGIPDLPSLTRPGSGPIPTYPPPAVPDTQHAPFMNHSTLPDGTVFIAVGAILAAFGLTVIVWRGIVACLLHRSVERASQAQHHANDKAASFPAPPGHVYSYVERDSSPVHGSAAALLTGRPQKKSHKAGVPSSTPSQTNLFFSPTAAPAAGGLNGSQNARFLPSGFYASAAPGHNGTNSISMSTLRPSSRGRMGGPSPPDSPLIAPRRNFSSSTVNLAGPPSLGGGSRAPSAFLDDLLGDQQGGPPFAAPGQAPPQQYPQYQQPTQQQYQPPPQQFPSGPDGQYYSHSPSPTTGHRF